MCQPAPSPAPQPLLVIHPAAVPHRRTRLLQIAFRITTALVPPCGSRQWYWLLAAMPGQARSASLSVSHWLQYACGIAPSADGQPWMRPSIRVSGQDRMHREPAPAAPLPPVEIAAARQDHMHREPAPATSSSPAGEIAAIRQDRPQCEPATATPPPPAQDATIRQDRMHREPAPATPPAQPGPAGLTATTAVQDSARRQDPAPGAQASPRPSGPPAAKHRPRQPPRCPTDINPLHRENRSAPTPLAARTGENRSLNPIHLEQPHPAHPAPPRIGPLRNGNPRGNPNAAPRCGARTRAGCPCRAPAMHDKLRCRMHGGASTGPRTAEGLGRLRAARTTHGRYAGANRTGNRHTLCLLRRTRISVAAWHYEAQLPLAAQARLHADPPELHLLPEPPPNRPLSRAEDRAIVRREATALAPWKLAIDYAQARRRGVVMPPETEREFAIVFAGLARLPTGSAAAPGAHAP